MSKIGISLKIDVSKIDKNRLFRGQKGTYLDATVFVELSELDQYGNSGMITQDVTKDEKTAGTQGAILGNGKVFWVENGQAPQAQQQQQQAPQQQPQQAYQQPQQQQQPVQQPPANQPQGVYQQQPQQMPDTFDDSIPF